MDNIYWLIDYRPVDFDFRFANHEQFLFKYLKYAKLLRDMSYSCTNVIILNMIEDGVAINALDIFNWFGSKFDNRLRAYAFFPVGVDVGPIQVSAYVDAEKELEYISAMDSVSPGWNRKQFYDYTEDVLNVFTQDMLKRKIENENGNNDLFDVSDERDVQVSNMLRSPFVGESILDASVHINDNKKSNKDEMERSVDKGKVDVKLATIIKKKGFYNIMYVNLKVDNEIFANNSGSYYAPEGVIDLALFQHKIDKQLIVYVKQPNVVYHYDKIKVNKFGGTISDFLTRIDPSWEVDIVMTEIVLPRDEFNDEIIEQAKSPDGRPLREYNLRNNRPILKTATLNMHFLIMQKMLAIDKEFKSLTNGRDTLIKALVSISKNVANVLNIIMNFNHFDNFENMGVMLPKPIPSEVLYYMVKAQKSFRRSGFDFVQSVNFFEVDYPPMADISVEIENVRFEVKWRIYKQKRGDDYNYLRVYLQEHKIVVRDDIRLFYPVLYMIYHNNLDLFYENTDIRHYKLKPKMLEDLNSGNCYSIRHWL